ncbi:hypothetical protein B0H11DRAFT_695211 [Mycena galericulata]|nr:hypothetical protein B0H11DRAFT_695211 [Mycena galericulata]
MATRNLISEQEYFWVEVQPLLLSAGYRLRARYQPDWIPSWANTSKPGEYEDSLRKFLVITFQSLIFSPYGVCTGLRCPRRDSHPGREESCFETSGNRIPKNSNYSGIFPVFPTHGTIRFRSFILYLCQRMTLCRFWLCRTHADSIIRPFTVAQNSLKRCGSFWKAFSSCTTITFVILT